MLEENERENITTCYKNGNINQLIPDDYVGKKIAVEVEVLNPEVASWFFTMMLHRPVHPEMNPGFSVTQVSMKPFLDKAAALDKITKAAEEALNE